MMGTAMDHVPRAAVQLTGIAAVEVPVRDRTGPLTSMSARSVSRDAWTRAKGA